MTKATLLAAVSAVAISTAAIAAPPSITYSADGSRVYVHADSSAYTPPLAHRSNLPVIYSNLATDYPKGVYNAFVGAAISGHISPHGQHWVASAFTPAADAVVQEVDLSTFFILGLHNMMQVHIYADAGGLPGQDVWVRKFQLGTAGTCCALDAIDLKAPLKLKGGTQYWLGVTSFDGAEDASGAFNLEVSDYVTQVLTAVNTGSGWASSYQAPVLAFGIYGK